MSKNGQRNLYIIASLAVKRVPKSVGSIRHTTRCAKITSFYKVKFSTISNFIDKVGYFIVNLPASFLNRNEDRVTG